jgi:hypothetical protein
MNKKKNQKLINVNNYIKEVINKNLKKNKKLKEEPSLNLWETNIFSNFKNENDDSISLHKIKETKRKYLNFYIFKKEEFKIFKNLLLNPKNKELNYLDIGIYVYDDKSDLNNIKNFLEYFNTLILFEMKNKSEIKKIISFLKNLTYPSSNCFDFNNFFEIFQNGKMSSLIYNNSKKRVLDLNKYINKKIITKNSLIFLESLVSASINLEEMDKIYNSEFKDKIIVKWKYDEKLKIEKSITYEFLIFITNLDEKLLKIN